MSSLEDWSIGTALRLRGQGSTTEGAAVLGVGIDWAEEFHLVALGPVNALAEASRDDLVTFARAGRHGWPDRFADRVQTALAADNFVAKD